MTKNARLILLITAPLLLLLYPSYQTYRAETAKKSLTPEVVAWRGDDLLSPGLESLRWRPGGREVTYVRRKPTTLYAYGLATGRERTIANNTGQYENLDLSSYQWSPDGKTMLIEGEHDLWLFDPASGKLRRLTNDTEEEETATFSPKGDRIAFVKKNDLYALDLKSTTVTRLTSDGSESVLNGKLDWVYGEELANRATSRAYEWSPDGARIAYLRLDDTPVPRYPLIHFLSTHVTLEEERFPQPGDPNPSPSLHVVAVSDGGAKRWDAPATKGVEYFGPALAWLPDSSAVLFLTLNREQTLETVRVWAPYADISGESRLVLNEKDSYWINSVDPPYVLKDGRFLWLSERDGWLHLYLYNRGQLEKQLTHGAWMIDHPAFSDVPMFQVDEANGWVYFQSTDPDPRGRQICRVPLRGGEVERVTKEPGDHSFSLSPDGRFIAETYSNLTTPPVTRLLKSDGTLVAVIDKPVNHLDEYSLPTREFREVKAADGVALPAMLIKPPEFAPRKKYPVVVSVYGGPHLQEVRDAWGGHGVDVNDLLAAQGFLVWKLDNRGSWGRGHAWESAIFEHMGRHELDDQLAGIEYLKSLPYVDGTRIGIWGWSYGGYMTLYSLTHAPDAFKCGIAGGPVTDWKFYDSIYTERYMRTEAVNPEGYREASPLQAAASLKAKLLLIHGVDDDNVHLQNTFNFVNALVGAGIRFELYLQPGQKHGFTGGWVQEYLDKRILEFFKQNL